MVTICLLSIELDILLNKILDICSFDAVTVLLSPMVSSWAVSGPSRRVALVISCPCFIS